jgi:anti-sigma regulatory factor (Ser/Thr protein kinase)
MVLTGEIMEQTTTDGAASVSLAIPGRAEYVALCRLVAGSLGAREGLDEEVIADLKVAVSEAFTCFLGGGEDYLASELAESGKSETAKIQLDFYVDPGEWTIVVSNPEGELPPTGSVFCSPTASDSLGITILKALVDSVDVVNCDSGVAGLRLVKNVSPSQDFED